MTTATPASIPSSRLDPERIGIRLGAALRNLVESLPGGPHSPTPLARLLGISRVTTSKLLNTLSRPSPFELLENVPGPESLRAMTRGASQHPIDSALINEANAAIEEFAVLIRDHFGTRGALNAAISPNTSDLQARFELASRYHVYKGMRQIMGVEAQTWLTSMVFFPGPDAESVSVATIHGAIAIRRLRPDVNVHFTFGSPTMAATGTGPIIPSPIVLDEFCGNAPAPLETQLSEGQMICRLAHHELGKRAVVDMLAASFNPRGTRRYAAPNMSRGGLVAFADIPAKSLVCDAILHDDIFPGAEPKLAVYNPGARGPANPNDPRRDIDLVSVHERVATLGKSAERYTISEIPRYGAMIDRLCGKIGHAPEQFRVFRLRVSYPIHGFQFVIGFEKPQPPAAPPTHG